MTYFELFDIPVSLKVDASSLRSRFLELSRQHHPDFHTRAQPAEQAENLERSALLNQAWKTFNDPDATIKYVLMSKGILEEEEKYELPPDFLMEVLEINEQLMDQAEADPSSLLERINELENEIYLPVKPVIENYDEKTSSPEALLQVKEYYYKKKYLDRIRRQIRVS